MSDSTNSDGTYRHECHAIRAVLVLIPILFVSTGTALADSQAFTTGFQTGFTNQSESQCDAYGNATDVAFDEHHCRAGFDQGQLKLMQSTPQYKIGLMAGRHDSTIANSTGDAHECNIYATIFQYNSCAKGFDAAYHYTYKGPLPIIAATTIHCNANNNAPNSCYHLGENDGIDAATALIKVCHRTAPQEPPGHHSAHYVLGFKAGWRNANNAFENDNASYGANNCR